VVRERRKDYSLDFEIARVVEHTTTERESEEEGRKKIEEKTLYS